MKRIATYLLASATLLGACSKDDTSTPSKAELLMAKTWRLTAAKQTRVNPDGTTVTFDYYTSGGACLQDNVANFQANKVLVVDEGPTRCSTSDPQSTTGTWEFSSDQTKLTFSSPTFANGVRGTMDILELTATTMRLQYKGTNSLGQITLDMALVAN